MQVIIQLLVVQLWRIFHQPTNASTLIHKVPLVGTILRINRINFRFAGFVRRETAEHQAPRRSFLPDEARNPLQVIRRQLDVLTR